MNERRRMAALLAACLCLPPVFAQSENEDDWGDDWGDWEESGGPVWTGFIEGAVGVRTQSHPVIGEDFTLQELRGRLETEFVEDHFTVSFKGEALADRVDDDAELLLRELFVNSSLASWLDLRLGRQVMTWGTGDLIFLNDLFPKGWVSFFAGRDDEYLKLPSDAVRFTVYSSFMNADVVLVPEFEPDNYIRGERFGFFSPIADGGSGGIVGGPVRAMTPNDPEYHLRLFRTIGGTELAFYGYVGYWKSPSGFTGAGEVDFPELNVWGGSLRGTALGGIANTEIAWYDSRKDTDGSNPLVRNSEFRLLLGYERELVANLGFGAQYYLEHVNDYGALIANSPFPQFEKDENRHLLTLRFTYRAMQDKLTLSWFNYYSWSDDDYYVRPVVSYRHSDRWLFTAGANLFGGEGIHTFFGQFEDDSNVYTRIRFNY